MYILSIGTSSTEFVPLSHVFMAIEELGENSMKVSFSESAVQAIDLILRTSCILFTTHNAVKRASGSTSQHSSIVFFSNVSL